MSCEKKVFVILVRLFYREPAVLCRHKTLRATAPCQGGERTRGTAALLSVAHLGKAADQKGFPKLGEI